MKGNNIMKNFGLYVITGQRFAKGRALIEIVRQALQGGAAIIQLREKEFSAKELMLAGAKIKELCHSYGAKFIVNDRVDVAAALDADGVHLGQDDLPIAFARQILGGSKIIGISTHSLEQALQAQADGADYIGVGPVFATQSKTDVCAPVGLELVRQVTPVIRIPYVAIGGIKLHNVEQVLEAGAKNIAVISEVVGANDITATARALAEKVKHYREA